MRVAVHHKDSDHPNASVFAYRFGRVESTSNPLTGEPIEARDLLAALLDQARAEFPESAGYVVKAQKLVATKGSLGEPDSEAEWQDADENELLGSQPGETHEVEVAAEQGTDAE